MRPVANPGPPPLRTPDGLLVAPVIAAEDVPPSEVRAAGLANPAEAVRRTATIRSNRPYAVPAVARNSVPDPEMPSVRAGDLGASAWDGVPVFSAWVAEPAGS